MEIRTCFKNQCRFPLWTLKYLEDDQTQKYNSAIDELFTFTTDADESINQNKICSLLKQLQDIKTELSIAFNKVKDGSIDLLAKFIKIALKQHNATDVSDNIIDEYKQYVKQHIQYEIPLWKQSDVELQIARYYAQKLASVKSTNDDQPEDVKTPPIPVNNGNDYDLTEKIKGSEKNIDDLKGFLIELANRFPQIKQVVKEFIDS